METMPTDPVLKAIWLKWFERCKHYNESRSFDEYATDITNQLLDLCSLDE